MLHQAIDDSLLDFRAEKAEILTVLRQKGGTLEKGLQKLVNS